MGYDTVYSDRWVARFLLFRHIACIGACKVWGFQGLLDFNLS